MLPGIPEKTLFLAALGFVAAEWIAFFVLLASKKAASRSPGSRTIVGYRLANGFMGFLPTAWLVTFGVLVLRARIRLGDWPHPGYMDPRDPNPFAWVSSPLDPKTMPLNHWAVAWVALAAALSIFVYPALNVLDRKVNGENAMKTLPLYVLTFTAMALVWVFDPGDFLSWYLD